MDWTVTLTYRGDMPLNAEAAADDLVARLRARAGVVAVGHDRLEVTVSADDDDMGEALRRSECDADQAVDAVGFGNLVLAHAAIGLAEDA